MCSSEGAESLWNDIFQKHWDYLGTEENSEKFQKRKCLEDLLKEFMYIAPHDRKFYLPETQAVLEQSVLQMQDFSARKASFGFDSISRYANNLLTKPWRKEYKTIKMYSGYYQHEIETNLLNADSLFIAMGYTKCSNDTLVLNGPICLDQVGNVSRDCMAAYVECQIMTDICEGLIKKKVSLPWPEIFHYRKQIPGTEDFLVKSIIFRKDLQIFYNPSSGSCTSCNINRHQHYKQSNYMQQHPQYNNSSICAMNSNQNVYNAMHMNGGQPPPIPQSHHHHQQQQQQQPPQVIYDYSHHSMLPHSKSLEHYVDTNSSNYQQNRHSFDHPYDHNPYDHADNPSAYQTCNLAAASYNVSGNRYPIPANISNQFSNSASAYLTNGPTCSNVVPMASNIYAAPQCYKPDHIGSHYCSAAIPTGYNSKKVENYSSGYTQHDSHCLSNSMAPNTNHMTRNDLLVEIDSPEVYNHKSNHDSYDNSRHYRKSMDVAQYHNSKNIINCSSMQQQQPHVPMQYALPGHNSASMKLNAALEKSVMDAAAVHRNNRIVHRQNSIPDYEDAAVATTNESRTSRASDFDSYEDADFNIPISNSNNNKNQDGVGSYDQWDFVYQSIHQQKSANNVDDAELLLKGLNLNGKESKKSSNKQTEYTSGSRKPSTNDHNNVTGLKVERQNGRTKMEKSKPIENGNTNGNNTRIDMKKKDNIGNGKCIKNDVLPMAPPPPPTQKKPSATTSSSSGTKSSTVRNDESRAIAFSSNEWSCEHCTFLNSCSTKICEICSKSKDFHLGKPPNGGKATTTCV